MNSPSGTARKSDPDLSDVRERDKKKTKNTDVHHVHPTLMAQPQWPISQPPYTTPSALPGYIMSSGSSSFQYAHNFSMYNPNLIDVHHGGVYIVNIPSSHVVVQSANAANDIEKYRNWLMPSDPSTNQKNAFTKHQVGTGSWLLEHSKYMDWKKEPNSLMWIHGISGAGKTILCSTIVQDIQSIAKRGKIGLAYFYCDVSDAKKRNVTDILSSLVFHLLTWQPSDQSLLHRTYDDSMDGLSKPFDDLLLDILKQFMSGFEMTYILIDALDECLKMGEILKFIHTLHEWEIEKCHILVTSRKEQQIMESMGMMLPLEIDMSQMPVDDDIKGYIDLMLHSSPELNRWSPIEKDLIRKGLLGKAKGMFCWVACQLDELEKCTKRRKTLDDILEHLPETLEATYDQILSRISLADASDAVKLLLWLAFAKEPLHIDYLAIIVQFDFDKKLFNSDAKLSSSADVLRICSSLVTRIGDNTVQLAHASVKQYVLEKKRIIQSKIVLDHSKGHAFIGQLCLNYLLHAKDSHPAYQRCTQPLMKYSAKYWSQHILLTSLDINVIEQMKELFEVTNFPFRNWVEVYNYHVDYFEIGMNSKSPLQCAALHRLMHMVEWLLPSGMRDTEGIYFAEHNEIKNVQLDMGQRDTSMLLEYVYALEAALQSGDKEIVQLLLERGVNVNAQGAKYGNAPPAALASVSGNKDIVQLLLERGANVNAQGLFGNALQVASAYGHKDIVQLLLEKGADVNVQGAKYGNALQVASQSGHPEIVLQLLERGADLNAQGGQFGNALQAASCSGHKEIVQQLLEKGADVNAQGGHYGNALQAALNYGHKEIVQLLLERGTDVNSQGGHYGNALQAALSNGGHKEIVQLLLERGADVNAQGGFYGNALQTASYYGQKAIVQLLLERGANVNAQGGQDGNALKAASRNGHKDIVQLLLERGAHVNAPGPFGNALQAASGYGHKEIVQLLLEKGVDVNAQEKVYGNALQTASRNGHKEIVQQLLEKGADVNAQAGQYGNALHASPAHGHKEIVQLLLERGADVNAQVGQYGNALQGASWNGHKDIVQLLLERGADVNVQGRQFGNALQAASSKGHKDIVQLSLERGADVNAQGGQFGNALQAVSGSGHKEIVQLLLERGADVNAQGGQYGNALQTASYYGHKEIVQLLLERGADVNAHEGQYGSALQTASYYGHKEIVQLLLEGGADVNAQGGPCGNALQGASWYGHIDIVQLLLASGADAKYTT